MDIIRYSADPHSTIKFMKANLEFINQITAFEVYSHEKDIPDLYRDVRDLYVLEGKREERPINYTLILRSEDKKQEVWLTGGTCGYSGSGPSATVELLQLLGIDYDYDRISKERVVIEHNLPFHHDLNFVICRRTDPLDLRREKLLQIKMKFPTAFNKHRAKNMIEHLGYIQPLHNLIKYRKLDESDAYYFGTAYAHEKKWFAYTTTNALTLNRVYTKLENESIREIIEEICFMNNAKFEIKMYEPV